MGIQLGLLIGFARTTSGLVDNTTADLWVLPYGTANVDISGQLLQRREMEVLSVPGVASADSLLVQFAFWKTPDGRTESVSVVGFDPATRVGAPPGVDEATLRALQIEDGILVERLFMQKLGVERLGQIVEINGQRARVVGFTNGIRSFTQSPYVFTTHARATSYVNYHPKQTTYVLVQLRPGADVDAVQRQLQARLPRTDVVTPGVLARRSQYYWLVITGAGFALLLAAGLGLMVGTVIVGQTLYSSTIDRLTEYATLRAMGASADWLRRIVLSQAVLSALLGYSIGIVLVWGAAQLSSFSTVLVSLPIWNAALLGVLTLGMCAMGAWMSIRRLARIEPSSVFQ
jgi:putative ABC transport system permease protein